MSIAAGLLIICIVFIRAVALNRLPKTALLMLWGVALFRLLLPVSTPARFSLFAGFRRGLTPATGIAPLASSIDHVHEVANQAFPSITRAETWSYIPITPSITQGPQALNIPTATIVWLAGMIAFFIFFAAIYMINYRRLRFATLLSGNDYIDKWLTQHRHILPITIMQSDRITTPLAVGLLKPRIILPKGLSLDDKQLLSHILTHEYYHIKRLDSLWKALLVCGVCIHWFNPTLIMIYGNDAI